MKETIGEGLVWACGIVLGFIIVTIFWLLVATGLMCLFDFIMGTNYLAPASVGIIAMVLFIGCGLGNR